MRRWNAPLLAPERLVKAVQVVDNMVGQQVTHDALTALLAISCMQRPQRSFLVEVGREQPPHSTLAAGARSQQQILQLIWPLQAAP